MGVLRELVEIIQKRIEEENHRTWLDVMEEVKNDLKSNHTIYLKK
ncbi:hypothetical protein [Tepidibacter mesophilus]|nr:hypothetical protein [Tepidibacter mesophilus]